MSTTTPSHPVRSFYLFVIASLLIHAAVLFIPVHSPVSHQGAPAQPVRLYAVELLSPQEHLPEQSEQETTPEDHPPARLPAAEVQAAQPPDVPAAEKHAMREATVSLNRLRAEDEQYRSYLEHLRSKIHTVWHYPPAVYEQNLSGTVTLRFSIARTGKLEALSVTNPSPHALLDEHSLRTLRAAAPFLAFPPELTIDTLHVLASFEYRFSPP